MEISFTWPWWAYSLIIYGSVVVGSLLRMSYYWGREGKAAQGDTVAIIIIWPFAAVILGLYFVGNYGVAAPFRLANWLGARYRQRDESVHGRRER